MIEASGGPAIAAAFLTASRSAARAAEIAH
jgi:hypothetical protein